MRTDMQVEFVFLISRNGKQGNLERLKREQCLNCPEHMLHESTQNWRSELKETQITGLQ